MGGHIFGMPDALTQTARNIDDLFGTVFWIAFVVFVLVEAMLVIFMIRYRRTQRNKEGRRIHGNTKAEVIWTLVPAIILVFIGIYSTGLVYSVEQAPKDPYVIKVTGMKWTWQFEYPNGATSINDLRIPENQDILFKIYSKDVIHSFWIPEFRLKQDAVPGRETRYWVKADDVSKVDHKYTNRIYCAEYCGNGHGKMTADFEIMQPDQFTAWVDDLKAHPKKDGASIAMANGCTSCHTIDGSPSVGPSWKGLYGSEQTLVNGQKVKADDTFIKNFIKDPTKTPVAGYQPIMPSFSSLDDASLQSIVDYMKTLN